MFNELLAHSQTSSKVLTMNQTDAFLLHLIILLITITSSCRSKFQISCVFLVVQSNPSPAKHLATKRFLQSEVVNLAKTKAEYAPCRISTTECSTYLLLLHIWQVVSSTCRIRTSDPLNLVGSYEPVVATTRLEQLTCAARTQCLCKTTENARCVLSGSYLRRHRTYDLIQDRALA